MDFIPKFTFEVLKPDIEIVFRLFKLNFIEIFLNVQIFLYDDRKENLFRSDNTLPVMKVVEFKRIEFGKGKLSED
jgi:hypothetical protein